MSKDKNRQQTHIEPPKPQPESAQPKQSSDKYKVVFFLYEGGAIETARLKYQDLLNQYSAQGFTLHSVIKDMFFVFEKQLN